MLRVVPIDQDTQLLKAMKAGAMGLKKGMVLNIYPEGERAFDGKLHEFKKGAAILATELNLPDSSRGTRRAAECLGSQVVEDPSCKGEDQDR